MFSRIYHSARALITDPAQNRFSSQTTTKQVNSSPLEMVTSRSQSRAARREDDANDDNTIHVYVSPGKKRKLRSAGNNGEEEEEEAGLPSSAKKRKILPVREKGSSPAVTKTIPVVEIPVRKNTPKPEAKAGSPSKPIEIGDDVEESEDVSEEEQEEVIIEKETEEPKGDEVDTKTKHKRFGSEEAEPEFFSTARENPEAIEEIADSDEDSDSEDDAPEAIGIQEAAKEVKSKERDTAKAVKEQLSASRKKRKERDEILKKQSEKGKKRKPVTTTTAPEESSSDSENEPTSPSSQPENALIPSHTLTTRSTLPSILPAEYLEDTEPQDLILASDENILTKKKAKKTKFIDAALKEPKDRRVGKTTYRVMKAGSTKLAPKSSFQARSTKEAWMQGRSGGKVDPSRRAFGKAFGRR